MPEQIVRQLELLKVDKALGPDELHPRSEMEAASGSESFGRYFLIHLQGWGGSRGLGREANAVALYEQCSWKNPMRCFGKNITDKGEIMFHFCKHMMEDCLPGLRKREFLAYKFTWVSETHYCSRRQMSSKVYNLSDFPESIACKILIYLINTHYLLKMIKN